MVCLLVYSPLIMMHKSPQKYSSSRYEVAEDENEVSFADLRAMIALPEMHILWGDGVHDDTAALNALFSNSKAIVKKADGGVFRDKTLTGGTYKISDTINITAEEDVTITSAHIIMTPTMNNVPRKNAIRHGKVTWG